MITSGRKSSTAAATSSPSRTRLTARSWPMSLSSTYTRSVRLLNAVAKSRMRMIEDPLVSVMRLVASLKFARDMVPLHCSCEAQLCGQLVSRNSTVFT
jgi:hypothetical protein